MIAEKINGLFDKKEIQKVDKTSISYRSLLYPYFENYFWYKLGINIVFGAKTDYKSTQLFLPIELLHSLDKVTIGGKPLVLKKEVVVQGTIVQPKFSLINSSYIIIFFILLILVINKRFLFKSYLFFCGLLGLVLCLIWLYSEHQEVLWNYNALLFNPLLLTIAFVKEKLKKKLIVIVLAFFLVYCIVMITKPHLLLMLPFMTANLYILLKLNDRNPLQLLPFVK